MITALVIIKNLKIKSLKKPCHEKLLRKSEPLKISMKNQHHEANCRKTKLPNIKKNT